MLNKAVCKQCEKQVPDELSRLTNLEHLQMTRNKLTSVHGELSDLPRLRSVIVRHNQVPSFVNSIGVLNELFHSFKMAVFAYLICYKNSGWQQFHGFKAFFQIKTSGIPTDIFRMKDLTIIDFSHNALREVPPNLEYAKCAIVLNLSHNIIETVPNAVSFSKSQLASHVSVKSCFLKFLALKCRFNIDFSKCLAA